MMPSGWYPCSGTINSKDLHNLILAGTFWLPWTQCTVASGPFQWGKPHSPDIDTELNGMKVDGGQFSF